MRGKNHTAALALALALLAGVAHAQPRDVAKADALFKEGRALMKNGDYGTACPKLEESYRLDPAAGTGINLGDCFERQGKIASALLAYQAARLLLKPGDPRIGPVEKEIASLDKRAPRLTIKLARGAPEGTTVKRDGREVEASKLGVPVVVNPGKYQITVAAPGRETAVFRVTLAEGRSRALEVGPAEATGEGPESDSAPINTRNRRTAPSTNSSSPTLGYVFLGIGGAGVIAGAIFGVMMNAKMGEVEDNCDGKVCNQDGVNAAEKGKTLKNLSILGYGVGAAGGLAATVYFLGFDGPSDETDAAVGAAATPGAGSIVLKGRF